MRQKLQSYIGPILVLGVLAVIAIISAPRAYFGFGVETDFLGGFMWEATSFLRCEPLQLSFHPPAYPMFVALFQAVVDDWFASGRLVSFVASAAVLTTSFLYFRNALSKPAAAGAVLALAASPVFMYSATFASSDVFFLAVYWTCLWAFLHAARGTSVTRWVAAGIVLGIALLSRTNAISLLLILLVPLLDTDLSIRTRLQQIVVAFLAMLIPLSVWATYAVLTDSPFGPSGTYINLALTFFPPDGTQTWADGVSYAEENFDSTWSVLAHDPVRLLSIYIRWLIELPLKITTAPDLMAYPFNLIWLPAILYLVYSSNQRWIVVALVIALAQIAIVNLKEFHSRYFLFLVPLLGAAAGHFASNVFFRLAGQNGHSFGRVIARFALIGIVALSIVSAIVSAYTRAYSNHDELEEVLQAVESSIPPGSTVIARKPNLAFYLDGEVAGMEGGADLQDLRALAGHVESGDPVFIYYGSIEQRLRPEYSTLLNPQLGVPWLQLVAASESAGDWVVYRYVPQDRIDNP